ncbi:MAG: carbohydrate ABC transporter permease [bacterium]
MKFLKKFWLEIVMILPLFVYILGFTFVPVLSNLKDSLVDQTYGRSHSLLTARINEYTYDMKYSSNHAERDAYREELRKTEMELEKLQKTWEGYSLSNYKILFKDSSFRESMYNTLIITGAGLLFQLILGILLALLLISSFKGKGIFRTIVLTPLGIPTIVAATIMTYIFDTRGYLNEILSRCGMLKNNAPIDWAQGGWVSIIMIVFADTWKVMPLLVLLFLAGLESIPVSVHEACQIDGVKPFYKFFTVTLPLLKPYITIAIILRAIDAFRIFELPLILAGTATLPVISTFTYAEYSRQNYNLSAASATILTGIILIFVFTYLMVSERERKS